MKVPALLVLLAPLLGAADLAVEDAGDQVRLAWAIDGVYRVPCWRSGQDGEWIPIHVAPLDADGLHRIAIPRVAGRAYALRRRGAETPFLTYEAEADPAATDGRVVRLAGAPAGMDSTPELEASGRAYVELEREGARLDIAVRAAANALVVRHCIPDAPAGGGIDATLSLYVNGAFRQKLALTSRFAWLYGKPGANGQSEDPAAGQPHVFWDEARAFIQGAALRPGDVLSLRKDAGDAAAWYRIDLVDLEAVAPPAPQPPADQALSVADFGAIPDDAGDDTAAIQACIDAAHQRHLAVWLPPGTWRQSARLDLDGVALRGAGMWYTTVEGSIAGDDWGGRVGFSLHGDRPSVSGLLVTSAVHTSRAIKGGKPFTVGAGGCRDWRIEDVWVTHTNVGLWMAGSGGVVRGSRIRCTYADAINIGRGASGCLVEGNHVRGCGDDGIALLSETGVHGPRPTSGNTVRGNTVSAIWWGHNGDLAGGEGNTWEDNLFADNSHAGVFTINLPGAYPMYPVTGALVRRNSFLRGGGNGSLQKRGAVWIFPGSSGIDGVVFRDNEIRDPVFRGIHIVGSQPQRIVFERTLIDHPGEDAIVVGEKAQGGATFIDTLVTGLAADRQALVNPRAADYAITGSGNPW